MAGGRKLGGGWEADFSLYSFLSFNFLRRINKIKKILYVGRLKVFFRSRWDDVNDMRCFMCIKGLLLSKEVP